MSRLAEAWDRLWFADGSATNLAMARVLVSRRLPDGGVHVQSGRHLHLRDERRLPGRTGVRHLGAERR